MVAGRQADVIVLDSLEDVAVNEVFVGGRLVAAGGRMIVDVVEGPSDPPLDTMKLAPMAADDFRAAPRRARRRAPDARDRRRGDDAWDETDSRPSATASSTSPPGHLVQVTVHRHGRIDPTPHAALLAGWGDWTGAVATTVAHDTHNLVVFGRDPDDMALAANTVIASGGGVAVVRDGAVRRRDRAADRGASSRRCRRARSPTRSARCRTPRSPSGSAPTPWWSPSRCSR